MKNKKGLSNLIATTLIILLSIGVIGTLYVSVNDLLQNPSLSPDSCTVLKFNNPIEIKSACYNEINQDIEISVNLQNKIKGKDLVFITDQSSYNCGNTCGSCNTRNDKYFLSADGSEKTISLGTTGCILDSMEINVCS